MADHVPLGREFQVGRVLARSASVLFRNLAPFGLLALLATSPTYLYALLIGSAFYGDAYIIELLILGFVKLLLIYLVTAALVFGTVRDLSGDRAGIGECFARGASLMFPVLGVVMVSGILVGMATLVFIVPGIIVAVMLWVVVPVAVIERRGLQSVGRSTDLTQGNRGRIFILYVLVIVVLVGTEILQGVLSDAAAEAGRDGTGIAGGLAWIAPVAIEWLLSALYSALLAVVSAVSYLELRVAKEGADSREIAAVFD